MKLAALPVTQGDIRAAALAIAPHVRRTPALAWTCSNHPALDGKRVTFKLEQLQVGGSFKARGAVNRLAAASREERARGVVTASGGNHGIGVAWAASRLDARATVYLPSGAPLSSEERLVRMGAEVVRAGGAWDDAWRAALARAAHTGELAIHPFEDPLVIAGQGTVGLELLEDAPDLDAVVVAIGGGGLIAGVATAARALVPEMRVIGVEPTGAPSMKAALEAGEVVELSEVKSIAGTLNPRSVGPTTLAFARALVDDVVLVSDDEMRAAMRLAWEELRLLVEPAGAAALAAVVSGRARLDGARHIGILLCGANLDVAALLS